jgi:hypothetical protein
METIAPVRMRSVLAVIVGLALSGCGTTSIAPPLLVPNTYALKKVNEKIYSTFIEWKIPGTVEISSVHKNEALGTPAQWAICLRNDSWKGINYFVFLIDQSDIVDFRRAIQLDRCSDQSYVPLLKPEAPQFVLPEKRNATDSRRNIIVSPNQTKP